LISGVLCTPCAGSFPVVDYIYTILICAKKKIKNNKDRLMFTSEALKGTRELGVGLLYMWEE